MPVVAVKAHKNIDGTLLYFILGLLCYTHATLLLSFDKKGPGGCLIRVDLIRFPGSIPGATQMCTYTNYAKQRSKVSILNIRQVVGLGIEVRVSILNIDKYWVLTTITYPTKKNLRGFVFFDKGKVKEEFNSSHLKAIQKNNIFKFIKKILNCLFYSIVLLLEIFLHNCPPSWINFYFQLYFVTSQQE